MSMSMPGTSMGMVAPSTLIGGGQQLMQSQQI